VLFEAGEDLVHSISFQFVNVRQRLFGMGEFGPARAN